jgi:hypothetical protein
MDKKVLLSTDTLLRISAQTAIIANNALIKETDDEKALRFLTAAYREAVKNGLPVKSFAEYIAMVINQKTIYQIAARS